MKRQQTIEEIFQEFRNLKRKMAGNPAHNFCHDGITPAQFQILFIVKHQPSGISLKELAQKLGITSSGATQLIAGLIEKNFLTREQSVEDQRAIIIKLSKEGESKIGEVKIKHLHQLSEAFTALDDHDLTNFLNIIKKINTYNT
ncbi:MAG: MarR family transcriptional regulator [Candidatus Berkelbacteria bacterium]|nr:MarR family transcriptional regulator [Candidatus Berkelbacteria bacterium]